MVQGNLEYQKPSWDEAVGPTNLIPDSLSFLSAKDFVATFGRKPFAFNETGTIFPSIKLPNLPSDMIAEEHAARLAFLNSLNVSLAAEALVLQWGKDAQAVPAVAGILKLSLQPLWTAFVNFAKKRSDLRKRALKGCNMESPHYLCLIHSSPFSEGLFSQEAIDTIKQQSLHQSKPISALLNYRQWARKRDSSSRSRTPKRARTTAAPSFSSQRSPSHNFSRSPSRRPSTFSNSQQGIPQYFSYQENDGSRFQQGPRRGLTTPRGRGYRNQGNRGNKTPSSPRRQGNSQQQKQF